MGGTVRRVSRPLGLPRLPVRRRRAPGPAGTRRRGGTGLAHRHRRASSAGPGGCGARWMPPRRSTNTSPSRPTPSRSRHERHRLVRPHRAPARAPDPHRGQCRHRQDLRPRRAGHPLRRRARRAGVGALHRELHRSGHVGAPGARAGAAGRRRGPPRRRCVRRPTTPSWPTSPRARPTRRASRRSNLESAVADFDTATISTIHGFCSRLIAAAGADTTTTVADDRATIEELVDDHYLAHHGDGSPPLCHAREAHPGRRGPTRPARCRVHSVDDEHAAGETRPSRSPAPRRPDSSPN